MAFQLSPGVLVVEKDLTSIIPAVASSTGAFAGTFVWGPVMDPTQITSENNLVARFGRPVDGNATSFFTAANFLAYTNNLLLVRADSTDQRNAVATPSGTVTDITISNPGSGYTDPTVVVSAPQIAGGVQATATAVVNLAGEIEDFVITNPGSGYTSAPSVTIIDPDGIDFVGATTIVSGGIKINNEDDYLTNYVNGAGLVGEFAARFPGVLGNSIRIEMADANTYEGWDYAAEFDGAPNTSTYADAAGGSNDELHVIVIDEDGAWTGTRGAILEKFAGLSKAVDARKQDGTNNYYRDAINSNSKYIWWMDHTTDVEVSGTAWGLQAEGRTFKSLSNVQGWSLTGGVDDLSATDGQLQAAWAIFANAELYDISLVPTGQVSPIVARYIVENVVDTRRDCVAFVSPTDDTGNMIVGLDAVEDTINYRFAAESPMNISSSYAVMDSGWKYMYDRYNDVYRWVPLNGDVAGLCARTDYTNDAWWSPGGLNRGQIKGVVKLNINPNKAQRDELYKVGINPVVSFPGQGTVLFGDKTLLAKPSAFDRINVRRLFIVLEKAIATAAKYQLFEFNDSFTRAQFRSIVEPFLRDVQGRRGVIDFRVKCDESNNTGEVVDRNEFVADIFIKPNRSINFITLNFIAARTSVSFDEIGG